PGVLLRTVRPPSRARIRCLRRCVRARCRATLRLSIARPRRLQRPVDLGDRRHARLVLALFDAIEGLRANAGAAGPLGLPLPEFAAVADDLESQGDAQVILGWIVAAGQLWGQQ